MDDVFTSLRAVLVPLAESLNVATDTPTEYTLTTRKPSPHKQHKGQPLQFAMLKHGKAYVSFHLMPMYQNDALQASVDPAIAKRKQGKTCFNFRQLPTAEELQALSRLTTASLDSWRDQELI